MNENSINGSPPQVDAGSRGDAPAPARGLSPGEIEEIQARARVLVSQLESADGALEMKISDEIAVIGAETRRAVGGQLQLLRSRLGTMLDAGGASEEIAKSLRDLRLALREISPGDAESAGRLRRVIESVPVVGGRSRSLVRRLNRIAIRYEPVSRQVSVIETRLLDGRALLARDNLELRKLYEEIEEEQRRVQRDVFLGEVLSRELSAVVECTEDQVKQERLRTALFDVAVRTQDLREMEEVYFQAFVSIEMGRQNNTRLAQAVERTVSLATNVVTVGLAIQSALVRQRKVQEATRRAREFLGELVATNARSIRRHTEEIGDLYSSPIIAIDKLSEAHNDLLEAVATAGQLRQQGIESAQENVARLAEMAGEIAEKVAGLSPGPVTAGSLTRTPGTHTVE